VCQLSYGESMLLPVTNVYPTATVIFPDLFLPKRYWKNPDGSTNIVIYNKVRDIAHERFKQLFPARQIHIRIRILGSIRIYIC
jgi:hypothetical protein